MENVVMKDCNGKWETRGWSTEGHSKHVLVVSPTPLFSLAPAVGCLHNTRLSPIYPVYRVKL